MKSNKNRIRYNFEPTEVPKKKTFSFYYQIAAFPVNKKYHLRKYVFDEEYNFVNIEEYRLSAADCKKFYEKYPAHKYKLYSVSDLNIISEPSVYDLQTSLSDNLGDEHARTNLESMYASLTGETVDYSKLYNHYQNNGMFPSVSDTDIGNLDDNIITDFAQFR